MGYTLDTAKGLGWIGTLRGATRAVAFIRIAILARILLPREFGLFGIAALILSFLEIFTETGINIFLIQLKEEIKEFIDTAWVVSIVRGAAMSLLILASAPFVSQFFGFQGIIPLLMLTATVPLIRGFINPSIVKFQKNLEFNKEFWFRTSIYMIDALTVIIVALITKSAISMVWGLVISSLAEVCLSFLFIKPIPKFSFEYDKIKQVINRGKWVTGFGVFDYLFQNIDDAIVGKILGAASLGVYQVAYRISTLPVTEVADVFYRVTFPIYVRISGDVNRLKKAFVKTLLTSGLFIFIIGLIVFMFPSEMVLIILGPNWLSAAQVLKMLAIYGILKGITGIMQSLFLAKEKQEYITFTTFISLTVLVITIFPLLKIYGLIGVALSAVIGTTIGLILSTFLTLKILNNEK